MHEPLTDTKFPAVIANRKPIVDFPAVAMVLMGVLSLISAIIGLMSGQKWKCCLTVFLALHGLNTIFQIALVASLWFNLDGVRSALDPKHTGAYDAAHMTRVLQAARVVMLLFVLCEITTFVLAILMRFVLKEDPTAAYNNFDEENLQVGGCCRLNMLCGSSIQCCAVWHPLGTHA